MSADVPARWREVVEHLVASRPYLPYAPHGTPSGPSEPLLWQNVEILAPREYSSCVAAAHEVLFLAMAQFSALIDTLSAKAMRRLHQRAYIIQGAPGFDDSWVDGIAGGLVEAGVADLVPSFEDALPGDFAQIQWDAEDEPFSGHSVVILSAPQASPNPGAPAGSSVVWTYSANTTHPKYPPPEDVLANGRPGWIERRAAGTQIDYISKTKAGKDRRWHIARLRADLVA